jgi:branched-chain amino acid transport system ATP-binding protein
MLLSLDKVNAFYGLAHILYDVSLSVAEGETVSLLGRNGAGKTTTLRSIMGLTPPASGRILYRGEPISGLPSYVIANKGIGYVPDDRRIFPNLTVEQNLIVALRKGAARQDWDIEKVYRYLPQLSSLKNRKGWNLSGGEQQMLAIARALMLNPDLLLVDEPTEGLAPIIVKEVAQILRELSKEKITILLVEQNAKLALSLSSRCYVLSDGHLFYEGVSDVVKQDPELMKRCFGVF